MFMLVKDLSPENISLQDTTVYYRLSKQIISVLRLQRLQKKNKRFIHSTSTKNELNPVQFARIDEGPSE